MDESLPIRRSDADEDSLFRAILADPWDTAARNAYADWMEERGAAHHAALTRAMIRPCSVSTSGGLLGEAMRAGAPCDYEAAPTVEGLPGVTIAARSLATKRFEREGPAWLRLHHVAEVRPKGKPSSWSAVFSGSWVGHARGLCFAGRPFAALEALAASPWLADLASLSFGPETPRGDSLATFFRQAGLRRLCRLSRRGGDLPADAMRAIIESPFITSLRSFDCGRPDDKAAALVLRSAAFDGLVSLAIMHGGSSGAIEVARARGLGGLRNLDLYRSAFDDKGVDALARSPLVARLQRLRLDLLGYETTRAMERLASALPPACSLVLSGEKHREALAAILGARLVLE